MTSGLTPVSPGVRNAVWYASSVSEVCFDFCLVSFGSLLWESVQLPFAALSFPLSTMTTLLQPHLNIMTTTPCYPSPCLSITWIRSAKNSSSVWLETSDLRQVLYTKKISILWHWPLMRAVWEDAYTCVQWHKMWKNLNKKAHVPNFVKWHIYCFYCLYELFFSYSIYKL